MGKGEKMGNFKLKGVLITAFLVSCLFSSPARAQFFPTRFLTLEESLALAMKNNQNVRSAREGVEKAQMGIDEARGSFLPSLDLSGGYTRNGGTRTVTTTADEVLQAKLGLTQPIYTGGKNSEAYQRSLLDLKVAQEELRRVEQDVAFQVKEAFYNVLLAQEKVTVSEIAVAAAEEHLRMARARFAAGTVAKFDVLQAEVELANTKPALIRARNSLTLAKENLKKVLVIDLRTPIEVVGELTYARIEVDMEEKKAQAQEKRPEMRQALFRQEIGEREIRVAQAAYYPSFNFSANYQEQSQDYGPYRESWNIGVVLSWNLFDGLITTSKVEQARIELRRVGLTREELQERIKLEVEEAILNLREAEERISTQVKNVELAEESLRLAQVRYENGVGTSTEVLDARHALIQAKTFLFESLYDYSLAQARLEKAVGG